MIYLASANDILDDSVVTVPEDCTLNDAAGLVGASGRRCSFLVLLTPSGHLAGIVEYPLRFEPVLGQNLNSYGSHVPPRFGPEKSAMEIVRFMFGRGHELVAVADQSGRFVGLVTRDSVKHAYGELAAS